MNLFICYLIFFYQQTEVSCEKMFDQNSEKINILSTVRIFGYKNTRNIGPFNGCCGNFSEFLCSPCLYVITARHLMEGQIRISRVLNFKKRGSELFEELPMIKIYNQAKYMDLSFNNIMNSNKIIDMIGWIENYPAFIYILDGAYGILGRIMMFMNIKIYSIDRNIKYDYFYVKVLSVLWKSYKFLNGECCNAFYCSLPCQHSFKFYINNKSFGSTNIYAPTSGDKLYRYDHYRFFTSKDLRLKENFNITLISIDVVKRFEVYDVFEISNLSFHPNSISPQIEAVSKHGKLEINLTMGNTCTGYTSDNCANICYAIKYVESCDYNNGSIICINGADDIKTCEKYKSKCRKDSCNGNGICLLDHNKIKCKCKTGFQGKYCQKWYCVKNCNRNGICEGSNTCNCYPLYKGYQCEMYLADKIFNRNNKTKNCYHHNNSLKCFCNKNFLTLKYCKKILCLQKIDSQANKELLSNVDSKCDCMKYFPGLRCHSTLISVYQMKSKSLLAKLLGSALALLIILLLTIIIRYYRHEHLILVDYSFFN